MDSKSWAWSGGVELRFGSFRPRTIFGMATSIGEGMAPFDPDTSEVRGYSLGYSIVFRIE